MPVENIKRFLGKAKETIRLPKEEQEVMTINLDLEAVGFVRGLAAAWHCTEEEVLVASLMAMCNETPQRLHEITQQTQA